MIIPLILSVFSLALLAVSVLLPGLQDLVLLAAPMVVASLYLLLRAALAGKAEGRGGRRAGDRPHIVIDGSNVLHWRDEVPQLETLREVIAAVEALGFQPGVIFDANAGYKIGERYLDDRHFARLLGLPTPKVLVVGRGTPADPVILAAARDLKAKIVTNDRYRDWVQDFPEVQSPGQLVRGGYRQGALWLDEAALGLAVSRVAVAAR